MVVDVVLGEGGGQVEWLSERLHREGNVRTLDNDPAPPPIEMAVNQREVRLLFSAI